MGRPITYFNKNTNAHEIMDWYFTGPDGVKTDLIRAYMNGVVIFEKVLTIILPCNPSYQSVNLRTLINNADPDHNYRLIEFILNPSGNNPAGCHHPTIITGDFVVSDPNSISDGENMEVTLINNGSIEQSCGQSYAIWNQSYLKIINNGYIRASGGRGGKGGNGKPGSSYTVNTVVNEGPFYGGGYYWYVTCAPFPGSADVRVTYKWNGSGGTIQSRATPCTSQKTSGKSGDCTYYRGSLKTGNGACDGNTYDYYAVRRKCGGTQTFSAGGGGSGGAGGAGQCYQQSARSGSGGSPGADGGHPPQTRGNSGCRGGTGAGWGGTGGPGSGGGSCYGGSGGSGPGVSIKGVDVLHPDSDLTGPGQVIGPTQP